MSAQTILRIKLDQGGSIEIVTTPGLPDVAIFVDAAHNHVAVDLTDSESAAVARALGMQ